MQDSYQNNTTQIYDTHAQQYKKSTEDFSFPWDMFETYLTHLKAPSRILDIWCAFGRDIKVLRNHWHQAFWLELSSELIKLADERVKRYIIQWDMTNISQIYDAESFDSVMSIASVVHMDQKVWLDVLGNCYNLLKKDGILYLSLKVADEEKIVFKESISTPNSQKKYVYHNETKINSDLESMWFTILKTHTWTPSSDTWKILICKK